MSFPRSPINNQKSLLRGVPTPVRLRTGPSRVPAPSLTALQPLGNQAAQKFAQTCPLALPSPVSCPFGGICHSCPPRVQTQLKVGQPGDEYEQEADRVADFLVRSPTPPGSLGEAAPYGPAVVGGGPAGGTIQRQNLPPEISLRLPPISEEEEEEVRAKPLGSGRMTPPASEATVPSTGGGNFPVQRFQQGGRPLSHPLKYGMERHFGVDLGNVRIHTDAQAHRACRGLEARAFTLGNHIAFARGEYQEGTDTGRHLIAHELTHVMQQRGKAATLRRQVSCLPGTASPYTPVSDTTMNCYGYVLNQSSILTPGELSTRQVMGGMDLRDIATYTAANVMTLMERDLGPTLDENSCCPENRRNIAGVVTNDATHFDTTPTGQLAPKVGSQYFDFHFYKQDADGFYSHKPGTDPTSRIDSLDQEITHPFAAVRSYSNASYGNYVGTFCRM